MELVDTHCHLFAEEFDTDRDEVIQRAIEAGVKYFLLPNIDMSSINALYSLTEHWSKNCRAMMGLHPTSVKEDFELQLASMRNEMDMREFVGVGEIGLDYYWDTTYKAQQQQAFREQLRTARERHLPVAIHTRESFEDAIAIVMEEKDAYLKGVFHCFTGSLEDARKVIEAGFMLGIGGVATFKNGGLDKVLPHVPLEYIVLETDAPYLAPVPYRGKRNESAYLLEVAKKVAEFKGISLEEVAKVTTENAKRLFPIEAT